MFIYHVTFLDSDKVVIALLILVHTYVIDTLIYGYHKKNPVTGLVSVLLAVYLISRYHFTEVRHFLSPFSSRSIGQFVNHRSLFCLLIVTGFVFQTYLF